MYACKSLRSKIRSYNWRVATSLIVLTKNKLSEAPMIDYHIHSSLIDGSDSIEEIIKTAISCGFAEIAITDHVWRTSTWTDSYFNMIRDLSEKYRYSVLCGFEAKAINRQGEVDVSAKDAERADFVLGVVHRYPLEKGNGVYFPWNEITPIQAVEIETQIVMNMIKNRTVDIVGHPTRSFHKFFSKQGTSNYPVNHLNRIVKAAKKHNVILEVNTKWFNTNLFDLVLKHDAKFVFGSDSHSCEEIVTHKEKIKNLISNMKHP